MVCSIVEENILRQTFEANLDQVPAVTSFVDEVLEKHDVPMKPQMQIDIAIDEIFSNIVKYGYENRGGKVDVTISIDLPNQVSLSFKDYAKPFNPLEESRSADTNASAEDRAIGGLGLLIVKNTMHEVKYEYKNANILTIIKTF